MHVGTNPRHSLSVCLFFREGLIRVCDGNILVLVRQLAFLNKNVHCWSVRHVTIRVGIPAGVTQFPDWFRCQFTGSLSCWSRRVGTSQMCSAWSVHLLTSVGGRFVTCLCTEGGSVPDKSEEVDQSKGCVMD